MSIEFVDENSGKQALQEVRSDANDTDWCVFGYENPKSQKIILLGKGSGGIEELKTVLTNDNVGYGIVRKTDKIDESVTVKFGFIMWIGENVPRMQKARISIHKGKVQSFIGQFHVDITASSLDELSEQILTHKIMDTSGSGSRVLDKSTGATQLSSQSSSNIGSRATNTSSKGNKGSLEFGNPEELKQAILDVRKNVDGSTWVLFTYDGDDSNKIVLLAKGTGDVDTDLLPNLNDSLVVYGLIRKVEKIDETEAVKFAFLRFVGNNIKTMLKARLGTHFGGITSFFNPYHVSIDATEISEISDERIMKIIRNASGTSVHVLNERPTGPTPSNTTTPKSVSTKLPVVPKTITSTNQAVQLKNEEEIKSSIKDVRNDTTDTDWVLIGYEGGKGNVLVVIGKGSGGVVELVQNLDDKIVAYGLVRKQEKIDESVTVKFAHIVWIGDNIDRMHRARLGTHKGAVQSLFLPYHVDIVASHLSEVSDDIISQKIAEASGTAKKYKD